MIKVVHCFKCDSSIPTFYVGRGKIPQDFMIPTGLGNPQPIDSNFSRDRAIEIFGDKLNSGCFDEQVKALYSNWKNLCFKEIQIACWCAPKSCHGELIKEKLLKMKEVNF